jgi:RNA polymerase sigma-70 factor (TIGR02960 family)
MATAGSSRRSGVALAPADEQEFTRLAQAYRRELHVHCYRLLGSFDEAEVGVQEALLGAWRHLERFDDRGHFRAWLYRIATNVCLDTRRHHARQVKSIDSFAEVPWLQPYPDRLLDETAPSEEEPDAVAIERETIELTFLAALQSLPPRQRAALVVRDVLGWPASETAALLDTSVAAANSAVQRARSALQAQLPARRAEWSRGETGPEEQALLERFIDAHERMDAAAAAAIASEEIRVTMPPNPMVFEGLTRLKVLLERAFGPNRDGDWRLLRTQANRLPAAASYLRRPRDTLFRPFKLDVLHVRNGRIAEITTFGYALFPHFGLPPVLEG